MNTLETIMTAPENTLVPISWVRENFLPEPDPELIAYRLAVATVGAFHAAIARGDIPRVLWSRGAAGHLTVPDDETPPEPMSKQFSKTIGDYGCSVRVYTRKDSSFYYLDYNDHNGKRIREPMLDPLTGFKISNRQVAIDAATIMAANLMHERAAARFKERASSLDPDTIGAILGPKFGQLLPEGVKVISEATKKAIHEDENEPSNIRLKEAWNKFGASKPSSGSQPRLELTTGFGPVKNCSLEFFGDIRLADITPALFFHYEESVNHLSSGAIYKRFNLHGRLFKYFARLVPSLREIDVSEITRTAEGKRYTKAEFAKLEAHYDRIHPDAAELFYVMTHCGWRVGMGAQVESSEVKKFSDDDGNLKLFLDVAIDKVKETKSITKQLRVGSETRPHLVIDPKCIEIILRRAALAPDGYLFAIDEDGKPESEPRTEEWFRDELKRLEEIAGVKNVKKRACHAFKREFASRYEKHPLVKMLCDTDEATIRTIYAEDGRRRFEEGLVSLNLTPVE